MGNRSSRHRGDPEIPSDDEFDRYGNPKMPPGLEDLDEDRDTSPRTERRSRSFDIPIISSVQALIRSVSKPDIDLPTDGVVASPDKVGAGLLIVSPLLDVGSGEDEGERRPSRRMALLLKRSPTSGNGNTWGLPGGNRDPGETDLWETAMREAGEEMGDVSALELQRLATVLTTRGKRQEKQYTVYVVEMAGWEAYRPVLNEEHTAWEWVELGDLLQGKGSKKKDKKLHPVVRIAVGDYGDFLRESLLG